MDSQKLSHARKYEKEAAEKITADQRPKFHLSPYTGWTNDPNGFSYYKGEYHLFYQYNPYSTVWDSMHWGHAVSSDMLRWRYLPAALAPDTDYDAEGCFSGSAEVLPDGRQLIIYTGVRRESGDDREIQTQCIAVGDGENYEKYKNNPVLDEMDIPDGKSRYDFRDPKIRREPDGSYKCVAGTCDKDRNGSILLFKSADGFKWEFESILIENDGQHGLMWECPDFFELDGKDVLITSPQDMLPKGFEYHNGNGTLCLIGNYDKKTKKFTYDHDQSVDYGIDFYAPQTTLTPDGRRVMIGWMQNWDTCSLTDRKDMQWFGQMSLPRELSIVDGRLIQRPIRELDDFRSNKVEYKNVEVNGSLQLDGIYGRVIDMELTIRPKDYINIFQKFAVRFAQDEKFYTSLSFRPNESILKIDRKFSGSRRAYIHQRRCLLPNKGSKELKLRIILDRFSVEVFANDGRQVMTATLLTDTSADGISFYCDGSAVMDITKYDLFAKEQDHEGI